MSQNIQLNNSNFCIGPQIGTYCYMDLASSPVTLKVKNSSGTLLRTYTFSPTNTLLTMPYVYSIQDAYIAGQIMSAKTFIFDFTNNYGYSSYMAIRSIEFYDNDDQLINLSYSDFSAYATTKYSTSYEAKFVFNTSLLKTGSWSGTSWLSSSGSITNQRLVCKFNSVKYVKKIVVNNAHNSGSTTEAGVRDTRIYFTSNDYTGVVYGSIESDFHKIFDSSFSKHVASNSVDNKILLLESEDVLSASSGEPVAVQYVGPLNKDSMYNGAIFYTLERVSNGYTDFYTYERDEVTGDYSVDNLGELLADQEVSFYSNIIRKWRINNTSFTLDLVSSFFKTSDTVDWFSADAFAIQTYQTGLLDHVSSGTGILYFTTTSGLSKYDTILIGPSSDTDNVNSTEEVYIHSVDHTNNSVSVRSYGGGIPTVYEYVEGDSVTVIKYAHLLSRARPILDSSNIRVGYEDSGGTIFTLDLNSYCDVIDRQYSGIFSNVEAAAWNLGYNTVSFIKGCNLIHYSLEQKKPIKSQFLMNMYNGGDGSEIVDIYDIAFNGYDIYRLQKQVITWTSGVSTLSEYSTYNYVVDALETYSNNITVYASNNVVGYQGVSTIIAIIRDQFGIGLLGKDVFFSVENDPFGTLEPADGNVVTNADGVCFVQYTASSSYTGLTRLVAKVGGANPSFGDSYLFGCVDIKVLPNQSNIVMLSDVEADVFSTSGVVSMSVSTEGSLFLLCFVRRSIPGGEWVWRGSWALGDDQSIDTRNVAPDGEDARMGFLQTVYQPTLSCLETDLTGKIIYTGDNTLPKASITQHTFNGGILLFSKLEAADSRYISQNYLSRHLSTGNVVTANLNQFVFTQEAIPNFWSERNTAKIDYWIRLRPYAYSLDTETLKIFVYDKSWAGTSAVVDIAPSGNITTFDAGSGLEGIDFSYLFPEEFNNNAVVYIEVQVYDHAPIPNLITISYWFKIIPDYGKPYIENKFPSIEEYGVDIDTEITFDVLDNGDGVDINTLELFINNRTTYYSYVEYEPGQFHISCKTEQKFAYGQEISVSVLVNDLSENCNLLRESWVFYCGESTGPWFDEEHLLPGRCLEGEHRDTKNIGVQVYAVNNTGINYDSLRIDIGGKRRDIKITPIIYRLK